MEQHYVYKKRAVAFLDVLGFREKLNVFQKEAEQNQLAEENESYVSQQANDFINTFKKAIARLDDKKFRYYLFSDNICITSINETTSSDLQDLFLAVTELYFQFARQGYFLRGGIDYGLFIDEDEIAVGNPLAVAYLLESKKAIYPRIILSDNLVKEFQTINQQGEKNYEYLYADVLIKDSCEIRFLNIFLHVFQSDYREDREDFFIKYSEVLKQNLAENIKNEAIYTKYKWLADEFNEFIDHFINELSFLDTAFDPEQEVGFLEMVGQQKIQYGN
ncbi:hypothetical protein [Pedobacter sp.]